LVFILPVGVAGSPSSVQGLSGEASGSLEVLVGPVTVTSPIRKVSSPKLNSCAKIVLPVVSSVALEIPALGRKGKGCSTEMK